MSCCITRVNGSVPAGAAGPVNQGLIIQGVDAVTPVGTTDDFVLEFTGATVQIGSVALADWVTRTDTAAAGTVLSIEQPGLYWCLLYVPWQTGNNVQAAMTKDATVAQRQSDTAEPYMPECYSAHFKTSTTIQGGETPSVIIPVFQADIDAGENDLRAHVGNVIGPVPILPAALIDPDNVTWRIQRIGDVTG